MGSHHIREMGHQAGVWNHEKIWTFFDFQNSVSHCPSDGVVFLPDPAVTSFFRYSKIRFFAGKLRNATWPENLGLGFLRKLQCVLKGHGYAFLMPSRRLASLIL